MNAIRINGIRVGHQMFHLRQYPETLEFEPASLLYQVLAGKGINLPCLGVEHNTLGHALSCCFEEGFSLNDNDPVPVCMVSVYPHGSQPEILGALFSLFGKHEIPFFHMVSSTAMISFVIAQNDKKRVLAILEKNFDLPPTHTPYEPGFHEETAAFVKKRYQETRAYFREKKIKTYGFSLEQGLILTGNRCALAELKQAGKEIGNTGAKFYFATAFGHIDENEVSFYHLLKPDEGSTCDLTVKSAGICETVDMISFHGPHFGDRFGIFNAAALCLQEDGIDFLLAGCTGASITLVVPKGRGEQAIISLEKGFEKP